MLYTLEECLNFWFRYASYEAGQAYGTNELKPLTLDCVERLALKRYANHQCAFAPSVR